MKFYMKRYLPLRQLQPAEHPQFSQVRICRKFTLVYWETLAFKCHNSIKSTIFLWITRFASESCKLAENSQFSSGISSNSKKSYQQANWPTTTEKPPCSWQETTEKSRIFFKERYLFLKVLMCRKPRFSSQKGICFRKLWNLHITIANPHFSSKNNIRSWTLWCAETLLIRKTLKSLLLNYRSQFPHHSAAE